MSNPLHRHQREIEANRKSWEGKPLLREIYAGFFQRMVGLIDASVPGMIVEIGSGLGQLKAHLPQAVCTDLFPHPWIDTVCDAYHLPFAEQSVSHLLLLDVFHHLAAPAAFFQQARSVLHPEGRVILLEPYLSLSSHLVYGCFHPEPVAWTKPIESSTAAPPRDVDYAAQGNATRLFFGRRKPLWLGGWRLFHAEAFACFSYLLSGGYSRPAFYPARWLPVLQRGDQWLSRWPRLFGGRCLVGLRLEAGQ